MRHIVLAAWLVAGLGLALGSEFSFSPPGGTSKDNPQVKACGWTFGSPAWTLFGSSRLEQRAPLLQTYNWPQSIAITLSSTSGVPGTDGQDLWWREDAGNWSRYT